MTLPPGIAKQLQAGAQTELEQFARETVGVQAAVLVTADGFELASYRAGKVVSAKVAAMGSSIQALAKALAKEAGVSEMRNTLIEAEGGTVLVMAVPDSKPKLTLAVVTSNSAITGHLMWSARNCCAAVSRLTH